MQRSTKLRQANFADVEIFKTDENFVTDHIGQPMSVRQELDFYSGSRRHELGIAFNPASLELGEATRKFQFKRIAFRMPTSTNLALQALVTGPQSRLGVP
jgi:hypothetical protein